MDSVPAGVFGGVGVDYVALGHLHGPQKVTVPSHVSRETTMVVSAAFHVKHFPSKLLLSGLATPG